MASEIKVDTIVNAGGDNDTGIDLATNDQILLKVANATKLTMNSTGQTTIVGEGGTTTTSVQQGLAKMFVRVDQTGQTLNDSLNTASITDGGTGFTSANLTNAFSSTNYSLSVTANSVSDNSHAGDSSTVRGGAMDSSGSRGDAGRFHMIAHGDLA